MLVAGLFFLLAGLVLAWKGFTSRNEGGFAHTAA
jgi:hypothetical protein